MKVSVLSTRHLVAAALVSELNKSGEFEAQQVSRAGHLDGKGVILIDLPRMSRGIDQIAAFAASTETPLVVLVTAPGDIIAEQLRSAGANAVCAEIDLAESLHDLIRRVRRDGFLRSPSFRTAEPFLQRLTGRQRQVLQLVLRGESDADIGMTLGISTMTAETHRRDAQIKLDCHGHLELVVHALRHGYLDPVDIPIDRRERQASRQRLNA